MAQIVFDRVTKIFEPDDLVLEDISFRVEKGSTYSERGGEVECS